MRARQRGREKREERGLSSQNGRAISRPPAATITSVCRPAQGSRRTLFSGRTRQTTRTFAPFGVPGLRNVKQNEIVIRRSRPRVMWTSAQDRRRQYPRFRPAARLAALRNDRIPTVAGRRRGRGVRGGITRGRRTHRQRLTLHRLSSLERCSVAVCSGWSGMKSRRTRRTSVLERCASDGSARSACS